MYRGGKGSLEGRVIVFRFVVFLSISGVGRGVKGNMWIGFS